MSREIGRAADVSGLRAAAVMGCLLFDPNEQQADAEPAAIKKKEGVDVRVRLVRAWTHIR